MSKQVNEWLESFGYAFVVLLFLYMLCWPFKVDGQSMVNTMYSGDRIVVSRISQVLGAYHISDIIVCKAYYNDQKQTIVKRVVGVPGDRVRIAGGLVYINEVVLNEPYVGMMTTEGEIDMVLSGKQYFVLGDNRGISLDSRKLGPIEGKDIVGKVIARWFPFSNFQIYK